MTKIRPIRFVMTALLIFTVTASALLAAPPSARAHPPHASGGHAVTPPPASAERKAIMSALRAQTLKMLGGTVPGANSNQIVFVVSHLKVDRGWAFVTVDPRSGDGKWRGDTFSELLHKANGRWTAVDSPAMESDDENFSEAKAMKRFRARHPEAPGDIY